MLRLVMTFSGQVLLGSRYPLRSIFKKASVDPFFSHGSHLCLRRLLAEELAKGLAKGRLTKGRLANGIAKGRLENGLAKLKTLIDPSVVLYYHPKRPC
jgi:hypothetical protein